MKLLVTGINGWIASALVRHTCLQGMDVRGTARLSQSPQVVSTGSISQTTDWSRALDGRSVVIHLAARVHILKDPAPHSLAAYSEVNSDGTLQLMRQAAASGVRRFVFVSSVKVNGESTSPEQPFRQDGPAAPVDPYGISKREAEDGLREIAAATGMEVVIVRPPLVYGPGVKANFAALMNAVKRGLPLPLGSVTENRRSLVALDNLVDLLITCIDHPAAANQTFLVSDDEDLSTADLLWRLGKAMGRPARLFPMPPALLRTGAALLGKSDMAERLLGNLQVDITHTKQTLGWTPPITVDEGLRRAAAGVGVP